MKKYCALILSVFITLFSNTSFAKTSQIIWRTNSLGAAVEEAKTKGLPVLFLVKSENCGNSKRFLNEVLVKEKVVEYINKNFIPFLVDNDKNVELSKKYKIYGLPSTIILNEKGVEIDRIRPYDLPELLRILKDLITNGKTIPELEEKYKENPKIYKYKKEIVFKSLRRFDIEKALDYENLIINDHNKKYTSSEEEFHLAFGDAYSLSQNSAKAIDRYKNILKLTNADHENAYSSIAIEYFIQKNILKGFKTIDFGLSKIHDSKQLRFLYISSAIRYNSNFQSAINIGNELLEMPFDYIVEKAEVFSVLALIYQKICSLKYALNYINEAIKLIPDDEYFIQIRNDILNENCTV